MAQAWQYIAEKVKRVWDVTVVLGGKGVWPGEIVLSKFGWRRVGLGEVGWLQNAIPCTL